MSISDEDWSEIKSALAGHKPVNPEEWSEKYAGDVRFRLPNGWVVVVFNDCNDWDYVDSVEAPDGRSWSPWPAEAEYGEGDPPAVHELAWAHPRDPGGWGLDADSEQQIRQWNENSPHAVCW